MSKKTRKRRKISNKAIKQENKEFICVNQVIMVSGFACNKVYYPAGVALSEKWKHRINTFDEI